MGFVSYEWLFYGGIAAMALAGLLFFIQTAIFVVRKRKINRKMEEEYGQPLNYNRKEKEN